VVDVMATSIFRATRKSGQHSQSAYRNVSTLGLGDVIIQVKRCARVDGRALAGGVFVLPSLEQEIRIEKDLEHLPRTISAYSRNDPVAARGRRLLRSRAEATGTHLYKCSIIV